MKTRIIGILLILTALGIALGVFYYNSNKRNIPLVFSPKNMLASLWATYKNNYWEADTGRTIDKQREDITTSEGQSYTMLRAVWMDDKPTFDKTWQWTKENLQRDQDSLFAWLYGKKNDGNWGVITERGGDNAASDGDTDIALALILAHARWKETGYLEEAKNIISAIWEHEVVEIQGVPYLAANNLEKYMSQSIIVNPSYFAPYAYRVFARVDPQHDWNRVVESSYDLLEKSSASSLDKNSSGGMPPDWLVIDRDTGIIAKAQQQDLTSNYSYDAMRIPWRIAMDYLWFQSPEAKDMLEKFSFLKDEWDNRNTLYASYTHDGKILAQEEAPAMYGGAIGYFLVTDPQLAKTVYEYKLLSLYNPDSQTWRKQMSYYDDNWAWFGLALYNNLLPHLAQNLDESSFVDGAANTRFMNR